MNTRGRGESIMISSSGERIKEVNGSLNPETAPTYSQNTPLHSFRDLNLADTFASSLQQPIINELMPFKASYACFDCESNAVHILSISDKEKSCEVFKISGLDSNPIAVYEDVLQNIVHVITDKNVNVFTYNKRSKILQRKSNYQFAQSIL